MTNQSNSESQSHAESFIRYMIPFFITANRLRTEFNESDRESILNAIELDLDSQPDFIRETIQSDSDIDFFDAILDLLDRRMTIDEFLE